MSAKKKKKKKTSFIIPFTTLGIILFLIVFSFIKTNNSYNYSQLPPSNVQQDIESNLLDLPFPNKNSRISVEQAINSRRTYTSFQNEPLSLVNLSQLLWSAQGVTTDWGGRTVPSSKSAFPLKVYAIPNQVTGLDQGIYKYHPGDLQPAHQLGLLFKADTHQIFQEITEQYSLQHAPLILVVTSKTNKIEAYIEAGQLSQNLFLQAESLGLGMAIINTFDQDLLREILQIPSEETIIYLIPVGHPKK